MSLDRVLGQPTAVATLKRALERRQVHHAYRFEGHEGVGKLHCAMAFAQALVCESDANPGCGQCRACELAQATSQEEPRVPLHPDIVLVQRGLYPPQLLGRTSPETTGISVQQIRKLVLPRAGYSPHEGRALCFIVNHAHELTISAANALLKTLEEPTSRTHFLLLTSRPGRLLDTVRSRTLAVRFGPLPDAVVYQIGAAEGVTREMAALAEGSVSRALQLTDADSQQAKQAFVQAAFSAMQAPDLAKALAFSAQRPQGREGLSDQLSYLAQVLAHQARQELADGPAAAERLARAHQVVLQALTAANDRNAQPGLLLESMIAELRAL